MLMNPVYTGQLYADRIRAVPIRRRGSALRPVGHSAQSWVIRPREDWIALGTVPALVSQELFDLVQAKLARNQQFARRNAKAEAYLLRALVSCGVCRLACTGRMMHPGYEYYWCNGKRPALPPHLTQKCPARYIPVRQLDELVWQDLCQVLLHPEQLTQALQRVRRGHWLPQELQARGSKCVVG